MFKFYLCSFLPFVVALGTFCSFFNFSNLFLLDNENSITKLQTLTASTSLLKTFVEEDIEESSVETIKFDDFSTYSTTFCFSADTLSETRSLLSKELRYIPKGIFENLLQNLNSEVCTGSESKTSFEGSQEVAFIYWHLQCSENAPHFHLCVSITRANVLLSEVVVGSVVERENVIVGYEPCKCTIFNAVCRDCPIIETIEKTKEIKKRPQLTLKQHAELTRVLHSKAVDHARKFIANENLNPVQLPYTRESSTSLDNIAHHT